MIDFKFTDEDLHRIEAEVKALLIKAGIAAENMSSLGVKKSFCGSHTQVLTTCLSLPGSEKVHVAHCGCKHWFQPTEPPAATIPALTLTLAEELVWYWGWWKDDAGAMKVTLHDAIERESTRARSIGLDMNLVALKPATYDTFRGRNPEIAGAIEVLADDLRSFNWPITMRDERDVKRFFRRHRQYQKALVARRAELAGIDAHGEIDSVAIAAIECAGLDVAEALRPILNRTTTLIDLGGTNLMLAWRLGTLEARLQLAPGISWEFGRVRFEGDANFPATVNTYGKPLGDFFRSPVVPFTAEIRCTHRDHYSTTLMVDPEVRPIRYVNGELALLPPRIRNMHTNQAIWGGYARP